MMFSVANFQIGVVQLLNDPDDINRFTYVETHRYPKGEEWIKNNLDNIKNKFAKYGLEFVYIPELTDILTDYKFSDTAKYYAPWITPKRIEELRDLCKSDIQKLYDDVRQKSDDSVIFDNIDGKAIKLNLSDITNLDEEFDLLAEETNHLAQIRKNSGKRIEQPAQYSYLESFIKSQEKGNEKISPLLVEDKNKPIITLPDYDMDIRLRPAQFTYYMLFLKHPEGIYLDLEHSHEPGHISNYRSELISYHKPVARYKNSSEGVVDNMIEPFSTMYSQKSMAKKTINEAFEGKMRMAIADNYKIIGFTNEPLYIKIARMGKVTLPEYN